MKKGQPSGLPAEQDQPKKPGLPAARRRGLGVVVHKADFAGVRTR
jgi:hypothetical protein